MVFHTIERIIGSVQDFDKWKQYYSTATALKKVGFSDEESRSLGWLYDHRTYGRNFGFAVGVLNAFLLDRWTKAAVRTVPRLVLYPSSVWVGRIAIVFFHLQLFDYITTARRGGVNSGLFADFYWTNTRYTKSKENFVANFQVMNRKFTQAELEILAEKQKLSQSSFDKRYWIYNPNIHTGLTEEQFYEKVHKLYDQHLPPWELKDVQYKIIQENKQRINEGEEIIIRPYDVAKDIDLFGIKSNIRLNPITNHWHPLY